MYISGIQF